MDTTSTSTASTSTVVRKKRNSNDGGCYCMILTGHPCCGKTSIAYKIKERIQIYDSTINVVHIQDDYNTTTTSTTSTTTTTVSSTDNDVNKIYGTNEMEKKSRGNLKSSFERIVASSSSSLSSSNSTKKGNKTTTLIILDSMNYIKGYRYELHCISKASACYHSVVWCLTDPKYVVQWNTNTNSNNNQTIINNDGVCNYSRYNPKLLQELILRYEPPDERNRWDRPLYKIHIQPQHNDEQQKQQDQQDQPQEAVDGTMQSPPQQPVPSIDHMVLSQSVYNMHNLSNEFTSSTSITQSSSTSLSLPVSTEKSNVGVTKVTKNKNKVFGKASSTFKRSGKQKAVISAPIITTTTTTSVPVVADNYDIRTDHHQQQQQQSTTIIVQPLTNETLLSLNNSNNYRTNTFPASYKHNNNGSDSDNNSNNDDDDVTDIVSSKVTLSFNNKSNKNNNTKVSSSSSLKQKKTSVTEITNATMTIEQQIDAMIHSFFNDITPLSEGTSTRQHIATNADVLQSVEIITQQICSVILSSQVVDAKQEQEHDNQQDKVLLLHNDHVNNSSTSSNTILSVTIPTFPVTGTGDTTTNNNTTVVRVSIRRPINCNNPNIPSTYSPDYLQQLRKQYIQWTIRNPPENHTSSISIARQFLSYIDAQQETVPS